MFNRYLAGSVISSCVNTYVAKKNRELQKSLSEAQLSQQKKLADRQIQISEDQMKLQKAIAENNLRLQAAIAEKNLRQQMELSHENRELQKQLAVFTANAQRETALLNTREGIEENFSVSNFPLYIRKSSYANAVEDITRRVKIVFSPPSIGNPGEGVSGYTGSDIVMTSWLTRFLQEHVPEEYYEYLGSAWRDDRFRAQSAYRSIFNEFSSQPFIILDCDILRNSFNFRICFWAPGGETYCVRQIITDFKTNDLLMESARTRARQWREEVYKPLIKSGKTIEELRVLFPQEINNEVCLEKEEELQKIVKTCKVSRYSYITEDYDYCIKMVSQLNAIAVGIFLDLYHMTMGNAARPFMLGRLSRLIQEFPDSPHCRMKAEVENWVVNEYWDFTEELLKFKKKDPYVFLASGNNSLIGINCKIETARILIQLSRKKEASQLLEECRDDWCETMLGIKNDMLYAELKKPDFFNSVIKMMLSDREMIIELSDLYELNKKIGREADLKPVKPLLDRYRQNLLFGK